MIFILRSARDAARVMRETEACGTLRAIWLFHGGGWIAATRFADGAIDLASSPSITASVHVTTEVLIVKADHETLAAMPFPPETCEAGSSGIRIREDLEGAIGSAEPFEGAASERTWKVAKAR